MGKVNEYDGSGMVNVCGGITLKSAQVGQCAEVILSAVPVTYDVFINDDLVYSCNKQKNAETIYSAVLSDIRGEAYKEA